MAGRQASLWVDNSAIVLLNLDSRPFGEIVELVERWERATAGLEGDTIGPAIRAYLDSLTVSVADASPDRLLELLVGA